VDCKNIKLILAIVFIVITSALSFVIGVSVGVNSDQSFLTEVIIPSLSAMGSWVAGLGALAAVFTSLWLAEQQKKINGENLTSVFDVFVFLPDMTERLAVKVTSTGNKPSNLNSLSIYSKDSDVALMVAQLDHNGNQLPMQLSYGQEAIYILPSNTVDSINDYVQKNCSGSYENLMLSVNTSINSFNIPFNEKVIEYLEVSGTNK
jgi:hypothetical protein